MLPAVQTALMAVNALVEKGILENDLF